MKNLVYIQTFNRFGSGILFPCKYKDRNTCVILTNYHVIRDLKSDGRNKKEFINLEFYDMFGNEVKKEFIKAVYVEYGEVCDNESDLALLLVELDKMVCISFDFEEEILWEKPASKSICSVGYPNILQDDDVNRRLIIEGKVEDTFPQMKKLGIYKITDSYHWYKHMSDRDLFEGFSGGPVYLYSEQKKYLIGINQSLCNVGDGDNPFKLVYFIRIRQAFEFLRENGIILFEYNDGKIEIEWTGKGLSHDINENEREISVLLLGGSGSGKSSFINELMLHGDAVNASGDGQTTRMDIDYSLNVWHKKTELELRFYNKEEFAVHMEELTNINRIIYSFQNPYCFPYRNLEEDMIAYLRIVFEPLEKIDKIFEKDSYKKIIGNNVKLDIPPIIIKINDVLRKGDDAEKEEIVSVYKNILSLFGRMTNLEKSPISPNKISAIFREDWRECYHKNCKKEDKENVEISLEEYIEHILRSDNEDIENYVYKEEERQQLYDVLNSSKGFFDVKEFFFLFDEKEPEEHIRELVSKYQESIDENIKSENTGGDKEENRKESVGIKQYYEELYEYIYNEIYNKVKDYLVEKYTLKIEFSEINEDLRQIIGLCLKVIGGSSLSGMVKKVHVIDLVSNNYALMVKRSGIKKIKLIDTCGLDHIERGSGIKRILLERYTEYKDNKIKLDAVFYLKKLDAGKPTELERILPILYNIEPDQPIFNIFTGADIFYGGREEYLINFPWSDELYKMEKKDERMRIPKSVAYIYDSPNIVKRIPCSEERKRDLYRIIKENLMPFVSETEKRKCKDFAKSNRIYLKDVLESLLSDEWNSGYVDRERIIRIIDEEPEEFIVALENDINNMFWSASIFDWKSRHHMTVNANVRRIFGKVKNENYMGYNGIYLDRWDLLLKEGFQEAFLTNKSEVIEFLSKKGTSKSQLERMFGKLKENIIKEDVKYNKEHDKEESKFRKIFVKMYSCERYFDNNPYQIDSELKLEGQKEKREYLEDICNFQKGLKNDNIKKEFRELFIDEIKKYVNEENQRRIRNLWRYKTDFKEKVNEVIEEMKEIAGKDDPEYLYEVFKIFLDLYKENCKK